MFAETPLLEAEMPGARDALELEAGRRCRIPLRVIRLAKRMTLCVLKACPQRCRRTLPTSTALQMALLRDRATVPPLHPQVLPDFTVRMAVLYLDSVSIARLMRVDQVCQVALSLQGLVEELLTSRGVLQRGSGTSGLGHVHLGEQFWKLENSISFDFMSADLSRRSCRTLDRLAELFHGHPEASGRVDTHAQPGAPAHIARKICQARACAVRDGLMQRGVASSRLRLGGFGTTRPLLGASDDSCRRAEIFMILDGVQFPTDHKAVRTDNSARWAAWIRGDAAGNGFSDTAAVVQTDSDDEDDA